MRLFQLCFPGPAGLMNDQEVVSSIQHALSNATIEINIYVC